MGDTRVQVLRPDITEAQAHRMAPLIRQWLQDEGITEPRNSLEDWMYPGARGDAPGPWLRASAEGRYHQGIPVCVIEGPRLYEGNIEQDDGTYQPGAVHALLAITTASLDVAFKIESWLVERFGGNWVICMYRL